MRLSPDTVAAIKSAAAEAFGDDAAVRLFGSRTDYLARGGDIDLHVEAASDHADLDHEVHFRALLWKALDEEQLDVLVAPHGRIDRWIDRAALRDGVVL